MASIEDPNKKSRTSQGSNKDNDSVPKIKTTPNGGNGSTKSPMAKGHNHFLRKSMSQSQGATGTDTGINDEFKKPNNNKLQKPQGQAHRWNQDAWGIIWTEAGGQNLKIGFRLYLLILNS